VLADDGIDVLSVPFGQLALCVVAAAVLGVVAAICPARRAARMDVLRAITTECRRHRCRREPILV
jgi:putative ABC transport system permease protein